MKVILYPFKIIYKLYFLIYFVLVLVLFFPIFLVLLSKKERFPKAFKVIRVISKEAPKLGVFKPGAVSIAIQKQIPILPITQTTNWKRLQRSGFWTGKARPGMAEVIIHPPISTKGLTRKDTEALQAKLWDVINLPLIQKYGV